MAALLIWHFIAATASLYPQELAVTPAPPPPKTSPAALAIVDRLEATITDPALLSEVRNELYAREASRALITGRRLAAAPAGCPPPPPPAYHSVFEITCHPKDSITSGCMFVDWFYFGFFLVLLIIMTIVIEMIMHKIEHTFETQDSLGHKIFNKMVRELALLGIVSFCAILIGNLPYTGRPLKSGSAWKFLMLELAHIMIFIMACVFCVVIAILYYMVRSRKHAAQHSTRTHVAHNTLLSLFTHHSGEADRARMVSYRGSTWQYL